MIKPCFVDTKKNITLYKGDWRDIVSSLTNIDHVITDPPYGNSETHSKQCKSQTLPDRKFTGYDIDFEGITKEECVDWTRQWVNLAKRWVIFTCEWKYASALQDAGLLIRLGIWRKPNGSPQFSGDRPGTGWEGVAICHQKGKKRWNGGGKHAFWTYNIVTGNTDGGHKCEKPVELYKSFLLDFTDPGDLILDPCCGSGSTGVACVKLGRGFIGIEKDEKWCEVAQRRITEVSPVLARRTYKGIGIDSIREMKKQARSRKPIK